MYEILNAHPATLIIIMGTVMVAPIFALATYVFSNASAKKGLQIGLAFLAFGAFMFWVCLSALPSRLGLAGNLIVPLAWVLPGLALVLGRDWFLNSRLSQRWLIGLQVFRVIGGVFLIEMVRRNLPAVFAYPAGIGDILVALTALAMLAVYGARDRFPGGAVLVVIVLGVADFLAAFFFGFTSSATPLQLFYPEVTNNTLLFPTGMIPLFLVPYAIFFHTLSALSYLRFDRASKRSPKRAQSSNQVGRRVRAA